MNQIRQYRSAWRKARREEDLSSFKQNIRNLIYYHQSERDNAAKCSLCLDDRWLYVEDVRHVIRLLLAVFHQRHVCNAHIEVFISKTLECLQTDPSLYSRLMSCEGKQKRQIVYRKIVLLLEIFGNQILLENELFWEEIKRSFAQKSEFMLKLMDCAYSYNEWPTQDSDENWDIEVKSICYTSVLNLFAKCPLLFHNYLQEYPISALLEKSKGKRRIELLSLLKSIISHSEEKAELEPTVYYLFAGFKLHLLDAKQLQHSLEIFIAQLQLFRTFTTQWNFMDRECINCIVCLIKTNLSLKDYTCELMFATLKSVREKFYCLFDHFLLFEVDSLLTTISAHAQQQETRISIEQSSSMQVQSQL